MKWKRKNNYERTIPELMKRRLNNKIAGVLFCGLTLFYMAVAVINYYSTGLVGPTVILCTVVVISFIAAFDSVNTVSEINLVIYLKEHEK